MPSDIAGHTLHACYYEVIASDYPHVDDNESNSVFFNEQFHYCKCTACAKCNLLD